MLYTNIQTKAERKPEVEERKEVKTAVDAQELLLTNLSELKMNQHDFLDPDALKKTFLRTNFFPENQVPMKEFSLKSVSAISSVSSGAKSDAKTTVDGVMTENGVSLPENLWVNALQTVWAMIFALTASHCAKQLPKPNLTLELLKQLEDLDDVTKHREVLPNQVVTLCSCIVLVQDI